MTESALKQIGIHEAWLEPEKHTPEDPLLRNWLLNTGSLTERLQSHCQKFRVQLFGQQIAEISADEQAFLYNQFNLNPEETQVREVCLLGNGVPWVFARSLLPVSFLHKEMDELTNLGEKPLGKIIFNDPRFERQGFQLVECPARGKTMSNLKVTVNRSCWGRRSLFKFNSHHIMVAEVFLPGSPAYANYQSQ